MLSWGRIFFCWCPWDCVGLFLSDEKCLWVVFFFHVRNVIYFFFIFLIPAGQTMTPAHCGTNHIDNKCNKDQHKTITANYKLMTTEKWWLFVVWANAKKKTTKIEWHRYGGLVYAKDTQNNKEVSSDKSHFTVNTTTIKFHLDEAPDTKLPIRRSCKRHCDTLTQNLPFDMLLPYLPSADVAVIEPEHNQYGLTSSGKRIK